METDIKEIPGLPDEDQEAALAVPGEEEPASEDESSALPKPEDRTMEDLPPKDFEEALEDEEEEPEAKVPPGEEEPKPTYDDEEVLEILESKIDPKPWIIGKPPQDGGTKKEYETYVQEPLGYTARLRWFAKFTNAVAESIKAGGTAVMGFDDVFGPDGGTIRERFSKLTQHDIADASGFATVLFKLMTQAPDFVIESIIIWLDIPPRQRPWAKAVLEMPHRPESDKWGLSDEMADEMIDTFIDQNYEEIRRFFVERLPSHAKRVAYNERERAKREREKEMASEPQESDSPPSKPSKPTQPSIPSE